MSPRSPRSEMRCSLTPSISECHDYPGVFLAMSQSSITHPKVRRSGLGQVGLKAETTGHLRARVLYLGDYHSPSLFPIQERGSPTDTTWTLEASMCHLTPINISSITEFSRAITTSRSELMEDGRPSDSGMGRQRMWKPKQNLRPNYKEERVLGYGVRI